MSKSIDEKVVSMRFDNKDFESNVQTSLSTLDKLKQSLHLDGAAKGLENVNAAARGIDMNPLSSGIETVKSKFSALEVMAVTALVNITNSAVDAGKKLISAFTIEPIKTGFDEFELKMGSVQTIMASTGESLDTVNKYLAELNTYSDKTIYSFSDMTNNIGKFTNAGVKLEDAVLAIKGISNEAAVSGANANEASRAMYNFSQALSAGYVKLIDWKSIENANMATVEFKDTLLETALAMGTVVKEGDLYVTTTTNAQGKISDAFNATMGFNDALSNQWMTTEVLTQALSIYATDVREMSAEEKKAYEEKLRGIGYTDEQIKKFEELGKKAYDSAQDVKTFSMMMDTLKEAAQSGWAETWELIVGDFNEGKKLWTELSKVFGDAIGESAKARNDILRQWKELGGRQDIIDSFWNLYNAICDIITPIKEAFRDIFPPMTGEKLKSITAGIKELTANVAEFTNGHGQQLYDIFKGLFSILDIGKKTIGAVVKSFASMFHLDGMDTFADTLLDSAAALGRYFTALDEGFDPGKITGFIEGISSGISNFVKLITGAFENLHIGLPAISGDVSTTLSNIWEGIKSVFTGIFGGVNDLGSTLSSVWNGIKTVIGGIWDGVTTVFSFIKEHISFGDIFAGLAAGGVFAAAKKFIGLLDSIKGAFENLFGKSEPSGIKEKFHDILDSVKDSLQSFTSGIKITSLVAIAAAIGILTLSLSKISELNGVEITKSLSTIGVMMTMLCASFKSLTKTLDKFDSKGVIKAGISLVLIAVALDVLADALAKIGQLSLKELVKGLIGVGGGLAELAVGLKIIDKVKISLSTSIAILALATSCGMLADALKKFGEMSWTEIGHGLVAMGLALGELVAAVSVLGKFGGFSSLLGAAGVWVIIKGMDDLAEALKKFGEMSWTEIGHGLVAMGGALLEVAGFSGALGKIAGFSGLIGAVTIRLVIGGLDELADALKKFGEMTWGEIGRGLTAMGGALLEMSGFAGALGKIAGFSGLIGAATIRLVIGGLDELADALKKFGEMSWSEIGRGLTAMGGALLEVSLFSGALGMISGFAGILGAASILIVIQGLDDLADALIKFGSMSWSEIGRGLTAMGGALLEVAGFSGALGMITGFAGILGAAAILIVIQGLDDLANALKKFGEMTWDEIGRGLVAMGGALLEVSLFSGALGLIAGFAGLLGAGTILLAVQGLGDLADALKKFGEMNWDEIGRGLTAMGAALGEIAVGSLWNTFSILGSLSIAAVAKPLGDLADSVKKWNGVVIPKGLGLELGKLAAGVMTFTYDGLGALSIAALAEPLGTLADSVKKWQGVTVPPAIGSQLKTLADGVKAFSWCFLAGWSLSALAAPLGDLAGSVRKWAGVTIPEGIGDQLKDLSAGVKSFSWAFMGAWSIDALIDPLSKLPDSVKKWNGVKIPENLKEELTSLADGIKSFSWAFMGAWSIDAIIEPLGNLATAVRKWQGVNIPSDVTTNLKNFSSVIVTFANNVKPLSTINSNGIVMFANSITILNTAVARIVSVDIDRINAFIIAVQKLGGLKIDVSSLMDSSVAVSTAIRTMMQSVNQIISSSRQTVNSSMKMAMSGMASTVKSISPSVTAAIKDVLSGFTKTINSQKGTVTNAFKNLVSDAAGAIKSNQAAIASAGKDLGQGFVSGVNSKSPASKNAGNTLSASAIDGAKGNQAAMASVGKDLGQGLVSGIKTKEQDAYDAGYALGQAAVQGEKDGQQSNSPSKLTTQAGIWMGEGLVIGMDRMGSAVYSSGKSMGEEAVNSISEALSQIGDMSTEDLAVQPTIKPVIDMTNLNSNDVQLGANINAYLTKPIDSLSAIITNAQDEMHLSNNEVIKAISGLREDLNSLYEMVSGKETNLYVDSKKLATSLAKPMNRELNILSKRGAY